MKVAIGRPRSSLPAGGQGLAEFALIVPVLLLLVLGALDFGRLMQAHITADSAVRAGASWGTTNLTNAVYSWEPDLGALGCGADWSPTCNIEARTCMEAAGFPGYNAGAPLDGGDGGTYYACATGTANGVCMAGASQSNPYLAVTWLHPSGASFDPASVNPQAGDSIEVSGAFCFQTFFPFKAILNQITWTSTSTYVIGP